MLPIKISRSTKSLSFDFIYKQAFTKEFVCQDDSIIDRIDIIGLPSDYRYEIVIDFFTKGSKVGPKGSSNTINLKAAVEAFAYQFGQPDAVNWVMDNIAIKLIHDPDLELREKSESKITFIFTHRGDESDSAFLE